ncbi:MAG TPA: hypothetical protein VGJ00_09420 [Rhabdochlamydiaceae bacterium]|jgi:hypothetical protein
MNILPTVLAFLLLFSFLTWGFIHQEIHSALSERSIHSLYKTTRVVMNRAASKQYEKAKKIPKPATGSTTPSLDKAPKNFRSKREHFPSKESGKCNLLPLFELQTNPQDHPLYEIAAQLLRTLYGNSLFKHVKSEGIEYLLLDGMIKTHRVKKGTQELCDLYPEALDLKPIFYKMLKGTNQYHLEKNLGILPLEDFFAIDKAPAIHFAFASVPLLDAMVGKKHALKILAEEKKKFQETGKNQSLTQDELISILADNPKTASLILELGSHLSFSANPLPTHSIIGQDTSTGLTIKKQIL